MRCPPGRPKPAQEREPHGYGICGYSLFTTTDGGSQRTGGICTEGQGGPADRPCTLAPRAPQPAEAEWSKIKPPSQTDDSARVYRDTKLRPSKTGAKSSQQFRSSSRTNVSRSSIRRWLPV